MNDTAIQIWNTCGYVRLSREDGDKEESNSVTGQKDLIRDFLRRHPELRECGMKVDDGYTGSNFDRPGFQEMLADIEAGRVNMVIVKDMSRSRLEKSTVLWSKTCPVLDGTTWTRGNTSSVFSRF